MITNTLDMIIFERNNMYIIFWRCTITCVHLVYTCIKNEERCRCTQSHLAPNSFKTCTTCYVLHGSCFDLAKRDQHLLTIMSPCIKIYPLHITECKLHYTNTCTYLLCEAKKTSNSFAILQHKDPLHENKNELYVYVKLVRYQF
jgi:hypothetical protein